MKKSLSSEKGAALIGVVLVLLLVLALMGAGLIEISGANAREASMELGDGQAFWLAEAGLQDALTVGYINTEREGEDVPFPSWEPREWSVSLANGDYTVEIIENGGEMADFAIASTGTSKSGISRTVYLNYSETPVLQAGAFGNLTLQFKPGLSVYSYDSEDTPNPTPADSTGEAIVSANGGVDIQASTGSTLDGTLFFGEDESGTSARETSDISGPDAEDFLEGSVDQGRIDTDPLNLYGDPSDPDTFAYKYNAAQGSNDNGTVVVDTGTLDAGNTLTLDKGGSVTIQSGTYFFDGWMLGDNVTVNIDASGGNVDIFMSDIIDLKNNGVKWVYNLVAGGAGDVRFFFRVEDKSMAISPNSSLSCFIYAPRLEVTSEPKLEFYGSIWANTVKLWPGSDLFVDTSIMYDETLAGTTFEPRRWRQSTRF
jgi:hypothetical protein